MSIRCAKLPAPITFAVRLLVPVADTVGRLRTPGWRSQVSLMVLQHNAERGGVCGDQAFIRSDGFLDGNAVKYEASNIYASACHQLEERRHVPLLGPTDVADGIVETALLVLPVVTSWAIRAREANL